MPRTPRVSTEKLCELYDSGMTLQQVADSFDMNRTSVYARFVRIGKEMRKESMGRGANRTVDTNLKRRGKPAKQSMAQFVLDLNKQRRHPSYIAGVTSLQESFIVAFLKSQGREPYCGNYQTDHAENDNV